MLSDKLSVTLDSLLKQLHGAMVEFVKDLANIKEKNNSVDMSDIKRLRDDVQNRLKNGEETADNKTLLKLIDLFATDKDVIVLMKEEVEDWTSLLETIEKHIEERGGAMTQEEKEDITRIKSLLGEVRSAIRKD